MKKHLQLLVGLILLSLAATGQNLLFTSEFGGANSNGAIMQYGTNTGVMNVYASLGGNPLYGEIVGINDDIEWQFAKGGLTLGMDGKYYGVAFLPSGIVNLNLERHTPRGIFYRFDPQTNKTEVLHAFTGAGEFNMADRNHTAAYDEDLAGPVFRVVEASSGVFYGIAALGGSYDLGGVWKFNVNTMTYKKIGEFNDLPFGMGYNPSSNLVHGDGSNLYGVLSKRNENNGLELDNGSLYRINTVTDQLEFVHGLNATTMLSTILTFPTGDIVYVPGSNKFYGTKLSSRLNMDPHQGGGVWSYNMTTNEVRFEWTIDLLETDILGSQVGGMVQANDGKLYVFSKAGGAYNHGTIIKYHPSTNTYAKVVDLYGSAYPHNSGFRVAGSKIFGNWESTPATPFYEMFSYDVLTGTFDNMIPSTTGLPGNNKEVQFIVANGKIIGRMLSGGLADAGSIFSYDPGTQVSTILAECHSLEGRGIVGELVQLNDTTLVGYTGMGGSLPGEPGFSANGNHELGDLVTIDTRTRAITALPGAFVHTFYPAAFNSFNNNLKFNRPLAASNGKLYYSYIHMGYEGDFFRISEYDIPTHTNVKIYNGQVLDSPDYEAVGLTEVSPGKILVCFRDSTYVYDFNTGLYTTRKYSHDMNAYGFFKGNCTVASDGRIYGTTKVKGYDSLPGSPVGNSVIFSLDPVNFDFRVDYSFDAAVKNCNAGLTELNGKLYGSTNYGGANNNGYLFSFDPVTHVFAIVHSFNRLVDGAGFEGQWCALDGKLFATSYAGGATGYGTLVQFDPGTSQLTVLKNLTISEGRSFRGTPVVLNSNVQVNATVSGYAWDESTCYDALQTLTVAGGGTTFTVYCGGSATFIAGHNIRFLPGTSTECDGYLHGFISSDNQYCPPPAPSIPSNAMVSGQSDPLSAALAGRDFILYPNPASSHFTLARTGEKVYRSVTLELCSIRGERLLIREVDDGQKHEFPVSDLQAGLYFVKIVADGTVETFKLVVNR